MPVHLGQKLPQTSEARIEIIPLIDIMFFLLAAFMLATLGLMQLDTVPVDLPQAQSSSRSNPSSTPLAISIDAAGAIYLNKEPLGPFELASRLANAEKQDSALRVLIAADTNCPHGKVLEVIDIARQAGISHFSFQAAPNH